MKGRALGYSNRVSLVIGVAFLALEGCAAPSPGWTIVGVREGMTQEEASAVLNRCRSEASTVPTQSNNLGVMYAQTLQRDNVLRACLEAHGVQTGPAK